jgi:ribosome-associated protein
MPEVLERVIEALKDKKIENLKVLNVEKLVSYTDYFVIGTGNNAPHIKALAETAAGIIKVPHVGGARIEGDQNSSWILIDGGDFVIHLFQPDARKFYNLESLWLDAKVIEG